MNTKYIIVKASFGSEAPIIFSELQSHKEVAAGREVLGAGFVSLSWDAENCKFKCSPWGSSTTLNVKSRPEEDAWLLERMFNDY